MNKRILSLSLIPLLLTLTACSGTTTTDEAKPLTLIDDPQPPTATTIPLVEQESNDIDPPVEDTSNDDTEPTVPPPFAEESESCTYNATIVAELSIPDGTIIQPGLQFEKVWEINNNGDCDWPAGTEIFFVSGQSINGPDSLIMQIPAGQGNTATITLIFFAPDEPGTYEAIYQLRTPSGVPFGETFSISIVVPEEEEPTPTPVS